MIQLQDRELTRHRKRFKETAKMSKFGERKGKYPSFANGNVFVSSTAEDSADLSYQPLPLQPE